MQFRNCKNLQIAQNIKCTYMTMLCRYHCLQKFHWKKVFGRVLHSINWLTKVFMPWKITKSRHTVLLTCISVHHVYTVVIPCLVCLCVMCRWFLWCLVENRRKWLMTTNLSIFPILPTIALSAEWPMKSSIFSKVSAIFVVHLSCHSGLTSLVPRPGKGFHVMGSVVAITIARLI